MTAQPRLSGVLVWMLRRLSSAAAANAAVGDILEELAERQEAGRAPFAPSLWTNWRVLESIGVCAGAAAPRLLRSGGHVLRDAARALWRSPSHALFIVLILSAGIAAATVTFSVVDAVVLRPLPFERSEDIVVVRGRDLRGATRLSHEEFWALHDRVGAFDSLAGMAGTTTTKMTVDGASEEIRSMSSTAELFRVLRVQAVAGRLWTADDEARDPHVVVIGYGIWKRRFGGAADVPGRIVRINDRPYRVVGVMRDQAYPRFGGPDIEAWVPDPDAARRQGDPAHPSRVVAALGRLKPGVSLERLDAKMRAMIGPLAAARPALYANWQVEARQWHDDLVGGVRGWMLLALGSVVLVVLIACANAANVMLTRSFERARELAVRASLGASRRQLALTLLIESVMLSAAAVVCALAFAAWGGTVAKAMLPAGIVRRDTIALDGRVLAASIGAALFTGLLFGLVPAWQASRVSIVALLKEAGVPATALRRGWRSLFLVAEMSCVAVLLVVSTLFVGSFIRVTTIDLGFDRSNLLAVLTFHGYDGTVGDVRERLAQIPGVTGVAAVNLSSPPLVSSAFGGAYYDALLRGVGAGAGVARVEAELYRVTPDYFAVLGVPFRRGSSWQATVPGAEFQPMVIDEVTARTLFGNIDVVGRQVHVDDRNKTYDKQVFTVTGVVPFVRSHGPEPGRPTRASAYLPINPNSRSWVGFFVRTSDRPASYVSIVEDALTPLVRSGGAPHVRVADDAFSLLTATRRFHATLMSLFAVLAMLIGAAGMYGVVASMVAQQTREIGIRVALGATRGDIRRGVLARAGRHLLLGLAIGLPAAWWMSRGFASLFFQVQPTDVSIYVIVAALLAAVGLLAAFVPARRASRVDPIVSLRAT